MKLDDDRERRVKNVLIRMAARPLTPRESREVDVAILVLQNRAAARWHTAQLAVLSLVVIVQIVLGWAIL